MEILYRDLFTFTGILHIETETPKIYEISVSRLRRADHRQEEGEVRTNVPQMNIKLKNRANSFSTFTLFLHTAMQLNINVEN